MESKFSELINEAMYIGVHKISYPIDVFSISQKLASHSNAEKELQQILSLVEDKENYFTRWAGIRAVSLMSNKAIKKAASTLKKQLKIETYQLAKKEILDTLSKLESNAT